MSDLKDQLIRLGSTNPELRGHLRPILAELDVSQKVADSRLNYRVQLLDEESGEVLWMGKASQLLRDNDEDPDLYDTLRDLARKRKGESVYTGGGAGVLMEIKKVSMKSGFDTMEEPLRTKPDYGECDGEEDEPSECANVPRGADTKRDLHMSNLKEKLIRLGSTNPSLRPNIRPILADLDKSAIRGLTLKSDEEAEEVPGGVLVTDESYGRPVYKMYARMSNGKLEFLGKEKNRRMALDTIERAARRRPL